MRTVLSRLCGLWLLPDTYVDFDAAPQCEISRRVEVKLWVCLPLNPKTVIQELETPGSVRIGGPELHACVVRPK